MQQPKQLTSPLPFFTPNLESRFPLIAAGLSLVCVLLIFLPFMLIGLNLIITQGETRGAQNEVMRAEHLFQNDLDTLDSALRDWATWDDAYRFVQDGNQVFIDDNLNPGTIANLDLDVIIALAVDGKIVTAKSAVSAAEGDPPAALPVDPQTLLDAYPVILSSNDGENGIKGLAVVQGSPMLVAARPVLTSRGGGPRQGTLIFIRLLDETEMQAFSRMALRPVRIQPAGSRPGLVPAPESLGQQVHLHARGETVLEAYKYLSDLNGSPSLLVTVENPRDLFAQGKASANVFAVVLIVLGLAIFFFVQFLASGYQRSRRVSQQYLERFQAVFKQSGEAILLVEWIPGPTPESSDWRILESNPASMRLLGWAPTTTHPDRLNRLVTFDPNLSEEFIQGSAAEASVTEHHGIRRDGVELDIELRASRITTGETPAYSLILHDITARKIADAELRASEAHLRASEASLRASEAHLRASRERYMLAAHGANDGLWDWNLLTGEIYYSPRWKAMLGCGESEIGTKQVEWFERVHPDDRYALRAQLAHHLDDRSETFECEYRIRHKDGRYLWMLARGVAVWDANGRATRMAGSQTDITARKAIEEQLRYDALHDELTGLANRTFLIDYLNHINERKRRNPNLLYALFFLDFDRFKKINDTMGHHAGDLLLTEAAHRLQDCLRASDIIARSCGMETLARIAGDEFIILLEDFNTVDDIIKAAERIIRLLDLPFDIFGKQVALTASIGLVVPETAYENVEDIIRDADIAMYHAKRAGGGQMVRFSPEMYLGAIERMQIETDLRRAIEQNEFEVYYQPIFTLNNDHLKGFEALIRWNHPTRGLLMPGQFISVAEETGLIVPMGFFVLEVACRAIKTWGDRYPNLPGLMVSVNVAARQFAEGQLVERTRAIIAETGIAPSRLWIEVTESTLLQNDETVLEQMRALRALGVRIEIDDFGIGYASLSYLKDFPLDGFKIDRSFIKDIQEDGQQIVKALIDLGHVLGLTQVAEGVETEHQRDYLKSVSCDYAQGFLMSRPISAAAVNALLHRLALK